MRICTRKTILLLSLSLSLICLLGHFALLIHHGRHTALLTLLALAAHWRPAAAHGALTLATHLTLTAHRRHTALLTLAAHWGHTALLAHLALAAHWRPAALLALLALAIHLRHTALLAIHVTVHVLLICFGVLGVTIHTAHGSSLLFTHDICYLPF